MSSDALEADVVGFLDRREREPSLTPEVFVASIPGAGDRLLQAIHAALELERLLASEPAHERRVGPYRLIGELGRGGMGVVHRAERDGVVFALKLLPLAPILGPRMLARFQRESAVLERLSHANIVRVHDSGMHDDVPYLVMDLVEGEPLHVAATTLDRHAAVSLMHTLALAVHTAHTQGVLHRDLKPQNVLVRADGSPVLLDFGLSAIDEHSSLTGTGDVLGTPRYMAPEQLRGLATDARTDVHALGLMLHELLTGQPAHPEQGREAVFDAVLRGRITPPRRIVPDLPAELEAIVLMAAASQPDDRYGSARALADDLARWLSGERTRARPLHWTQRIVRSLRAIPQRLRERAIGSHELTTSQRAAAAGLAAARDGDDSRAFEELTVAARLLPDSVDVLRALAAVCTRLGRLDDAVLAHRRELELAPDSAESWADLAELHVRQRAIEEGLAAVARAESLTGSESARLLRIRGTLEVLRGDQPAAQSLLRRALALAPDDAEARYRLAYSLDTDHDMAAAAPAYEHVLEVAPTHVPALLCLANLFAGASRGRCRRCDEFYVAHPDHLDATRAERYLLRAIEADRGADDWATRTARDIALQLADRRAVIALLTRLTQGTERTPAVLRLEEALRRVELLAG